MIEVTRKAPVYVDKTIVLERAERYLKGCSDKKDAAGVQALVSFMVTLRPERVRDDVTATKKEVRGYGMYCSACGTTCGERDRYCRFCGGRFT